MQRWEYKVVSLHDGHYTDTLNEYGRDGWELVGVAPDVHDVPAPAPARGGSLPMPRAFGRLEEAASKLNQIGAGDSTDEPPAGTILTTLLWVLRRPLNDDQED
jgi:hypothetical protein